LKSFTVKPGIFEKFGIIGLDAKLISMFGGELSFRVSLKRGRLYIVSEQCIK